MCCFVNSIQLIEHMKLPKVRYNIDYLALWFYLISLVLLKLSEKLRYYVSLKNGENKKSNLQSSESRLLSFFATNEKLRYYLSPYTSSASLRASSMSWSMNSRWVSFLP